MKYRFLFILIGVFCYNSMIDSFAQPLEKKNPQKLSPELIARKKTEQMDRLLQLSKKQFKKIFKLNLKEAQAIDVQQKNKKEMVPPPHMRGNGHDDFSRRPPMPNHFKGNGPMEGPKLPKSPEEIKKEAQKREKKLKRILTDNQYNIWKEFLEKNPRHKDHKVL